MPAFYGRRKVTLGDLFEIVGDRSDRVVVEGDLRHVKKIGLRMSHGRVLVRGNAGLHLGAYMQGGEIVVEGNASDWAGAQIQGGFIRIKGNAGHRVVLLTPAKNVAPTGERSSLKVVRAGRSAPKPGECSLSFRAM